MNAILKPGPKAQAGRHNPLSIAAALEQLAAEHGDRLTPAVVVAAAEAMDSPLHPCFEWDDALAGYRFRLDQARGLIANIRVRMSGENGPFVRAYVHVPQVGAEYYAPAARALSDPATRKLILDRALSELRALEARYRDLVELADVWAAARQVTSPKGGKKKR